MQTQNSCYFKALLKPINILLILLFACVGATISILCHAIGLWHAIFNNSSYFYFTICLVGLFLLLTCLFTFFARKKLEIDLADAIPPSMILFAIINVAYFLIEGQMTLIKALLLAIPFLLGFLLFSVNAFSFNTDDKRPNVVYAANDVTAYYKTFFKKFSLLPILLVVAIFTSLTTLVFHPDFSFGLTPDKLTVLIVTALPIVLYFAYNAGNKKISEADLILFGLTVSMPVALAEILLFRQFSFEKNITVWSIVFIVLILYTFMRLRTFDFTERPEPSPIEKKSFVGYYFKTVFRSYNALFILSIAIALAVTLFVVFPIERLSQNFLIVEGKVLVNTPYILVAFIDLIVAVTIFIGVLFSIINLPSNKVNFADFFLLTLIAFSLVSLVILNTAISNIELIVLFATLLFGLSFLFARARAVYYKEN